MYERVREASTSLLAASFLGLLVKMVYKPDPYTATCLCVVVGAFAFLLSNYHSDKMKKMEARIKTEQDEYQKFKNQVDDSILKLEGRVEELKNYSTSLAISKNYNPPQQRRM